MKSTLCLTVLLASALLVGAAPQDSYRTDSNPQPIDPNASTGPSGSSGSSTSSGSSKDCSQPCQKADTLSSSCTWPTFPNGSWDSVYQGIDDKQKQCLCSTSSGYLEAKAACAKCHVVNNRGQEGERWGKEIGQVKWVAGRVCGGTLSEAVGRALGGENGGNYGQGGDDDDGDDDEGDNGGEGYGAGKGDQDGHRDGNGDGGSLNGEGNNGNGDAQGTKTSGAGSQNTETALAAIATEAVGSGADGLVRGGLVMGVVGVAAVLLA